MEQINDLWPDWHDVGRRVGVTLENGRIVQGRLDVEDFFPDGNGDEVPMFTVIGDDGAKHDFAANNGWAFVEESQEHEPRP